MDDYDDYIFMVMYGASTAALDSLVELHCFYAEGYLASIVSGVARAPDARLARNV